MQKMNAVSKKGSIYEITRSVQTPCGGFRMAVYDVRKSIGGRTQTFGFSGLKEFVSGLGKNDAIRLYGFGKNAKEESAGLMEAFRARSEFSGRGALEGIRK